MRAVLLLGLFICVSGWCTAQTIVLPKRVMDSLIIKTHQNLPTWIIDSLIYEAKLSRQCMEVMRSQHDELNKLGVELVHVNTALKLSQSESATLSSLVTNVKESNQILTQQFALDIQKQKRKTKRWKRVAVFETIGVIVGLIVLL